MTITRIINGVPQRVKICPPADVSHERPRPTARAKHAGYLRYLRDLQDEREAGRITDRTVGFRTFAAEE